MASDANYCGLCQNGAVCAEHGGRPNTWLEDALWIGVPALVIIGWALLLAWMWSR